MQEIDFKVVQIKSIVERLKCFSWKITDLYHDNAYALAYVLDGEVTYTIGNTVCTAGKNDVLIFPPKVIRSGKTNPEKPWSFISIVFEAKVNDHGELFFENKQFHVWRNVSESVELAFKSTAKSWINMQPLFRMKCTGLITEILYRLFITNLSYYKVQHSNELEKTRQMIQNNFRGTISVEQLAKSIGISVSYYRQLFHEAYGYSPMQYITTLRIEYAKNLLLSGEVNVTEAAQLSGFTDIYYFSTLFKKKTGYTPKQLLQK